MDIEFLRLAQRKFFEFETMSNPIFCSIRLSSSSNMIIVDCTGNKGQTASFAMSFEQITFAFDSSIVEMMLKEGLTNAREKIWKE